VHKSVEMTLFEINLQPQQFQDVRIAPNWHDARCLFGQLHRPILSSLIQTEDMNNRIAMAAWINTLFLSLPTVFKSFYGKAMLQMSPQEQRFVRSTEMALQHSTPSGHSLIRHYVTRNISKINARTVQVLPNSNYVFDTFGKYGPVVSSSPVNHSTHHRLNLKSQSINFDTPRIIDPPHVLAFQLFCYLNRPMYSRMISRHHDDYSRYQLDKWMFILFNRLPPLHVTYYANAMNLILPNERLLIITMETRQLTFQDYHPEIHSGLLLQIPAFAGHHLPTTRSSDAECSVNKEQLFSQNNNAPMLNMDFSNDRSQGQVVNHHGSPLAFRIFYLRFQVKYSWFDTIQCLWRNLSDQDRETYEIAALLGGALQF